MSACVHTGHVHAVGLYRGDEEFRALIMPFVEEGLAAREPVVIGYDERKSGLISGWLDDPSAVTFLGEASMYATPARALESFRRLFERQVADGARAIRAAGDVPHEGNGHSFEGWDRYEAAINVAWSELPVRAHCLYDATTTSPEVLDVLDRTHPWLLTPGASERRNPRYEDPATLRWRDPAPDPLEATAPAAALDAPTAAQTRSAIRATAAGSLDRHLLQELLLGASEAVANAHSHGHAPVSVRIWIAPGRAVVSVRDGGKGPGDHLAGLMPARNDGATPGLGLWITHQLDLDVALVRDADGFAVRLRAGVGR